MRAKVVGCLKSNPLARILPGWIVRCKLLPSGHQPVLTAIASISTARVDIRSLRSNNTEARNVFGASSGRSAEFFSGAKLVGFGIKAGSRDVRRDTNKVVSDAGCGDDGAVESSRKQSHRAQETRYGDEIHVGRSMFEARRNKGRDRMI